ncbi:MAG: polyprenol monophosphomannose synthase [Anaerolineales bacterium]|nr:MAG: polyprenol monophosphomannose synthase [Anaerolineales bacterium]
MKTAVVIPTYNESANIVTLVEGIVALQVVAHIIIVDDNSSDGTGQIAEELAKQHQEVCVIHRPGKLGLGTAYVAGFKLALTLPTDCIVTMDADFSHHPRYIPSLIAQTRVYDLSIGSRYVDGGGAVNCNLWRRFLSRMGNTVARLTLGLKASDCTAGFRCYRRQVLEAVDLDTIFSSGYSFLVEMLYKCQQLRYRIGEVPIVFENRRQGVSKISRNEIWKAAYTVLRLGWERLAGSPHR